MTRLRWTHILFIAGAISGIFLYFVSDVEGFPRKIMLVFRPADYFWHELQSEAGGGVLRKIISNVAIFGLLAGAEGALLGLLLDFRKAGQRAALNLRVKRLRRNASKMDLATRRRVLEIFTEYDPAGLIQAGSENDAYIDQANMITDKLPKMRSTQKLRKFCRKSLRREFGQRVAGRFKKYNSLTKQIWLACHRQLAPAGDDGPVSQGL